MTGNLGALSSLLGTITTTLQGSAANNLRPVLNTLLGGLADPALKTLGVGIGELDLGVLGADTPDAPTAVDDTAHKVEGFAEF